MNKSRPCLLDISSNLLGKANKIVMTNNELAKCKVKLTNLLVIPKHQARLYHRSIDISIKVDL